MHPVHVLLHVRSLLEDPGAALDFTGNIRLSVDPLDVRHELVLGPGKATCRAREQGVFCVGGACF